MSYEAFLLEEKVVENISIFSQTMTLMYNLLSYALPLVGLYSIR